MSAQFNDYKWGHKLSPIKFYEEKGGRKYSELTGFYLISLDDILQQLKNPQIRPENSKDNPTVFIQHENLPKDKEFYIFDDEIKTFAEIMYAMTMKNQNQLTKFTATFISKEIEDLYSRWKVNSISLDNLDCHAKLEKAI